MANSMRNVFNLALSVSPLLVLHTGKLGAKSDSIRRDYLIGVSRRLYILFIFGSFIRVHSIKLLLEINGPNVYGIQRTHYGSCCSIWQLATTRSRKYRHFLTVWMRWTKICRGKMIGLLEVNGEQFPTNRY